MKVNMERFKRRYGLLVIGAALFTVYTVALSAGVAHRTEKRVTEEVTERVTKEVTEAVTAELRAGFRDYLKGLGLNPDGTPIEAEEEGLRAEIDALAGPLAEHAAGLRIDRKVTEAGAETYLYVDCARWLSGKHGESIEDVLSETGPGGTKQIEAYTPGHATRPEDREIAERVSTAIITGQWPDGFTAELQFAEINADGSVTARDMWKTDSTTTFWRIR